MQSWSHYTLQPNLHPCYDLLPVRIWRDLWGARDLQQLLCENEAASSLLRSVDFLCSLPGSIQTLPWYTKHSWYCWINEVSKSPFLTRPQVVCRGSVRYTKQHRISFWLSPWRPPQWQSLKQGLAHAWESGQTLACRGWGGWGAISIPENTLQTAYF